MLRNARVWLFAAGGWLLVAGMAHMAVHLWTFVLENGMVGQREFAMRAMRQALADEPLTPSMWRLFRTFSLSFGLLLLFAGSVNVTIAASGAPLRTLRAVALLGTLFWTLAFVPYAFVDPVMQPILVALVSVPLHGIAFLTASSDGEGG